MSGPLYYVLDGAGEPVAATSVEEWARWSEAAGTTRVVGREEVGDQSVSTVFLTINHQWLSGPPVLFETMIFGGPYDSHLWRWHTRAQAQAGHARIVAALREGRSPEQDGCQ